MYAFGFDKRSPPVLWNVVFTHKRSIRAFFLCRQTVWKRRLFVSAVYMWTKTTTMTTNGDEVEDNNNDRQWWICVVSARVPYELLPQETPPFFYHFSSCRFSFRLFNKFCSNSFSAVALSDFYHRYFLHRKEPAESSHVMQCLLSENLHVECHSIGETHEGGLVPNEMRDASQSGCDSRPSNVDVTTDARTHRTIRRFRY